MVLDFLHLSALQASLALFFFFLGCAFFVPFLFEPRNSAHRFILISISIVLALRYIWWRASETVPATGAGYLLGILFLLMEAAALVSSLSAAFILIRYRDRSREVRENGAWWGESPPSVAVLIPTYNEEHGVLLRTIAGAMAQDYGNFQVHILDDGRRAWLKALCELRGISYVTRDDNMGAKAGNMNNALRLFAESASPPEFIAVLDADFVPHHNFLKRTLALFKDEEIALVQTPQHFFNADPIQQNLGLGRSYPDEQRFFFDHLQPSRDGWGIAFCCGTSSVMRRDAIMAIGGIPTGSVTEDFLLTLTLQEKGLKTAYLNEPLTEGLAPEGLKEYVTQRSRWCLGLMQIARSRLGPLGRNGLRLRDRWSVLDSVFFWLATFPFRIAGLIVPLIFWYSGTTIVNASVADVVRYFVPYYFWNIMTLNYISRCMVLPIVNDVGQLVGAIPITRAAWGGLLRPEGHGFKVTAKGGDRSKVVIQWHLMFPYLVIFVLTAMGPLLGIFSDRFAFDAAGDGKLVILFWTFYSLITLTVLLFLCIEAPRAEVHLMDRPERAVLQAKDGLHRVWVTDLTQESVRVRGLDQPVGQEVTIRLKGVGDVVSFVIAKTLQDCQLSLELDEKQHEALLRRLHAEGHAPGITRIRMSALAQDIFRIATGRF